MAALAAEGPPLALPPGIGRGERQAWAAPEAIYSWAVRLREVARAVCKIETGHSAGTGFLVGPDLLLTNRHVVGEDGGDPAQRSAMLAAARFRFDYQDGFGAAAVRQGTVYKLAGEPVVDEDETLDFVLLRLDGTPGADLVPGEDVRRGWLAPDTAHDFQADEPLFTLGHFEGGPLRMDAAYLAAVPEPGDERLATVSWSGLRGPGAGGGPCLTAALGVVGIRWASRPGQKGSAPGALEVLHTCPPPHRRPPPRWWRRSRTRHPRALRRGGVSPVPQGWFPIAGAPARRA